MRKREAGSCHSTPCPRSSSPVPFTHPHFLRIRHHLALLKGMERHNACVVSCFESTLKQDSPLARSRRSFHDERKDPGLSDPGLPHVSLYPLPIVCKNIMLSVPRVMSLSPRYSVYKIHHPSPTIVSLSTIPYCDLYPNPSPHPTLTTRHANYPGYKCYQS